MTREPGIALKDLDARASSCMLEAVEIGSNDRACLSYETDYEYLRWELKGRVRARVDKEKA